jgi:hypothetical protein
MFESGKTELEKHRIETLSSIIGERIYVETMAQRPRSATDAIDNALLEVVLKRLAEIEAAARIVAEIHDLDDLEADAEEQGEFGAYFCPVMDIRTEGQIVVDEIEGWGIPTGPVKTLRELLDTKLKAAESAPATARSALRSLFRERNAWADYADDYEDTMRSLSWKLFVTTIILPFAAALSFQFAVRVSPLLIVGLLCAGAAGSCVSVVSKMPALDVSLKGEPDAYQRRVLSRIGVGVIASLVGSGLLAWLPVSAQNQTFADALTACASGRATGTILLTVVAFPMILGFSERALASFEQRVFGSSKKSQE